MDAVIKKQQGVHYTPPQLAVFLAKQVMDCFLDSLRKDSSFSSPIAILDPACGDGELLASLIQQMRINGVDTQFRVFGFDTDPDAVKRTRSRLKSLGGAGRQDLEVVIEQADFLAQQTSQKFDLVIANPPYVRTQVLGGVESRRLANKFELTGRVDLYYAFAVAISQALKPGGTMGLLTSNRFLSVKSGVAMRGLLSKEYKLCQLFDLGDTRLFDAAVLPAIVTATKRGNQSGTPSQENPAGFHRIYQAQSSTSAARSESEFKTLFEAISDVKRTGEVVTDEGEIMIERGELDFQGDSVWTLVNSQTRRWLETIRAFQVTTFGELAEIKVGIKTTADSVFIREDWQSLSKQKPESKLLLPLITHHDACRWSILKPQKEVLYPYDLRSPKRTVVDLEKLPRTAAYLESHRGRLEGRKYVVDSGREWFEIWVPHHPTDWAKPKLVWPDISEQPRFFFDSTGAIVNGDCYWIKLRPNVDPNWLYVMLAVANSRIAIQFYDTVFHNKLYAGRRRFMTQYVKEFPLPELNSEIGKQIVGLAKQLVEVREVETEERIEQLVQQAFGFK